MKCFQSIQKNISTLGIDSTKKPFNQRVLKIFLIYVVNCVLICAFLVRQTGSFREFIEGIYMAVATLLVVILFAIATFKMSDIFTFIEIMEEIIESSKSIFISSEAFNY